MHYLTKFSKEPQPICPRMKQISCFKRLVWVLKYCLEINLHKTSMHSSVFLFLIKYMILYLWKRVISSLRRSPKNPLSLKVSSSLLEMRNSLSYSSSKGAPGSFVSKQSFPYLTFKVFFLTFSIAISQVHFSSLQGESKCFAQRSSSSGKKQLANASAASCRDRLLSLTSFTTPIRKSLSRGTLSSFNCPKVYRTQCESRTESLRKGYDSTNFPIALSVLIFFN